MAEIAAGAVVAEQVVSTTIEGGAVAAGYTIAKQTMPLKATFIRIAVSEIIRRHSHTISVVDGKAYIFGGITEEGSLAGNEFHQLTLPLKGNDDKIDYKCIPALPAINGSPVPPSRAGHSATVAGQRILVYGGRDKNGHSVEEGSKLWSFDTETLQWTELAIRQGPKDCQFYHGAALSDESLMIYAGFSRPSGTNDLRALPSLSSVDIANNVWQAYEDQTLSQAGVPAGIAVADHKVFTVGSSGQFQSPVHFYDAKAATGDSKWNTVAVPSNPLVPGPDTSRDGAGVLNISTGHGRNYLLYFFGQKRSQGQPEQLPPQSKELFGDVWTFQLPSENRSLAGMKDATREKVGVDSGYGSWAEVDVKPRSEEFSHEGKAHPGPRSYFAASKVEDSSVILWGGLNPKQEVEGDGWLVRFE